MVLRQKPDDFLGFAGKKAISRPDFFHGLFWAVFLLTVVFMLALVGGLFIYGQWAVFLDVLKNEEFRFTVVFTLWTTLLATVFAVLFAIPCGFILSRHSFPAKALIETLLDVPIVLPPLVSGIALLILFGPLLGDKLARIGLDIVFSSRGVVVAELFVAAPFAIRIFKQAFDSVDPRLENLARTLGCSPVQVFFRVTMPMVRNAFFGGLTMTWARTLGDFGVTAMLAGITRMKTETLSVAIFLNMSIGDIQFAITTAIIMLLTAIVLLVVFKSLTGPDREMN